MRPETPLLARRWFSCTAMVATTVLLALAPFPAEAQTPITLKLDTLFVGDNTEFFNPFRSGQTILGAFQRVFVTIQAADRAELRLGIFANELAGSHSPFEHALPIVALRLGTTRQRLVLGTLESATRHDGPGPDRTTPHGLVPALQIETLSFTRPYEAGIQWIANTTRLRQDVWFDYQKTNTPEHREAFDGGAVGRARVTSALDVGYQMHIVHHGGQQNDTGPVSDSVAYGLGPIVERPVAMLDKASAEAYVFWSFDRPDRGGDALTTRGQALFFRLAGERRGWRGHAILWRGSEVNHEEGDPNYLSRQKDGAFVQNTRDYGELGVTRFFKLGTGVEFESSFRLHRIESNWDYSYRLLGTVRLDYRLR